MNPKLIAKRRVVIFVLTIAFLFRSPFDLHAQVGRITIDNTCLTYPITKAGCPTFQNNCSSASGWTSSHGTPEIQYVAAHDHMLAYYQMLLISDVHSGVVQGEGVFYPFTFIAGNTYTLTVNFTTTDVNGNPSSNGSLYLYAANNLTQAWSSSQCQDVPQTNSTKQLIGTGPVTSGVPVTFTANATYTQFWMYEMVATGTAQVNAYIPTILWEPQCNNISTPTGLTTTNGGTTLTWNAVANAGSYELVIQDTYNGNTVYSYPTTNTNSYNFCAAAAGDPVSYEVFSVCKNGAVGSASSYYSYTFAPATPAAPTNLAYTPPYYVTWSAVAGAAAYWYKTSNASPTYVTGTSISGADAELSTGTTTTISVAATNGCVTGPYANLPVTVPNCTSPTFAVLESGTYVILYGVTNAVSYNIGYFTASGTQVSGCTNCTNIPASVITGHGLQLTGVPHGSYYVKAQANCTIGTSAWSAPYENSLQTTAVNTTLQSATVDADISNNNLSDNQISIFPNPSQSEVNVVYNAPANGKADIIIVNALGSMVNHKTVGVTAGQNNYKVNVSAFANGVYVIKLIDGNNIHVQKLMVVK